MNLANFSTRIHNFAPDHGIDSFVRGLEDALKEEMMALAIGMDLDEVKEKLQELGYTELRHEDYPEAKWAPIATWNGVSPFIRGAGPTGTATISYFIEGDKLRVHKALEGDSFYLLR